MQNLKPGSALAAQSSLNEDDVLQLSVTVDCSLQQFAYASATFVTASGAGSAVMLRPDSGKTLMLKGRIAAADLASKVRIQLLMHVQRSRQRACCKQTCSRRMPSSPVART